MKKHEDKRPDVQEPAIEVIMRTGRTELAVVAFFEDGSGGYDVLVGVNDTAQRKSVQECFYQCARSVASSAFRPIHAAGAEGSGDDSPF